MREGEIKREYGCESGLLELLILYDGILRFCTRWINLCSHLQFWY